MLDKRNSSFERIGIEIEDTLKPILFKCKENKIFTQDTNGKVNLFDLRNSNKLLESKEETPFNCAEFFSQYLLLANEDIKIVGPNSFKEIDNIPIGEGSVRDIAVKNNLVAVGGFDQSIKVSLKDLQKINKISKEYIT